MFEKYTETARRVVFFARYEASHLGGRFIDTEHGSAAGFRATIEKAEALSRHFEVVAVPPPDEEETPCIAEGVKAQNEKFHGVTVSDEALETAISASRWLLRHRQLPDRVPDLIDEASAASETSQ
jgi:ATP-dependent Clp protease ATP-binding subunit ClpA